jgi:hypothetical protein
MKIVFIGGGQTKGVKAILVLCNLKLRNFQAWKIFEKFKKLK